MNFRNIYEFDRENILETVKLLKTDIDSMVQK